MEVHQSLPLFLGTALQLGAAASMTAGTHLLVAGMIERLNTVEASLDQLTLGRALLRGQAAGIGEELDDIPARLQGQLQAVHGLHARDRHVPTFRGLALCTNAAPALGATLGLVAA